jgi:hypothetical protein
VCDWNRLMWAQMGAVRLMEYPTGRLGRVSENATWLLCYTVGCLGWESCSAMMIMTSQARAGKYGRD